MAKPGRKRKSRKREMWAEYSAFLSKLKWTWFATFTTPYELTLKSARRLVERVADRWRKEDPTVRVFWVAEKFELKDGYHLHALVHAKNGKELFSTFIQGYQEMTRGRVVGNAGGKVVRSLDKKIAQKEQPWAESSPAVYETGTPVIRGVKQEKQGVWCRIQLSPFDPKRAAADYLVPYMFKEQSKGQGADYDWCLPCARRIKPPGTRRR